MDDERRRYFRIDDKIGITYEVVGDAATESAETAQSGSVPLDIVDFSTQQDDEINQLLEQLEKESPLAAKILGHINNKIERFANQGHSIALMSEQVSFAIKKANISACGISFNALNEINDGAVLKMSLTLLSENITLTTKGRVIDCLVLGKTGEYRWRIDFYDMPADDQETLIQYIVQRQSALLSKKWHK